MQFRNLFSFPNRSSAAQETQEQRPVSSASSQAGPENPFPTHGLREAMPSQPASPPRVVYTVDRMRSFSRPSESVRLGQAEPSVADETLIMQVTSTLEAAEDTKKSDAAALRHLASWLAQQKTQGHGYSLASLARLNPTQIQSILDRYVQAHPHLKNFEDDVNAAFGRFRESLTPGNNVPSRRRGNPMKGVPPADDRLIDQAMSTVNENTRRNYVAALRHLAVWLPQQNTQGQGHDLASLARLDAAQADGILEKFLKAHFEKKNLKKDTEKVFRNTLNAGFNNVRNFVIYPALQHDDDFNPEPSFTFAFAQASSPWPAATAQQAGHGTLSVPQEAFVVERPQENRWNAPVQPAGYSPPEDSFFDGASEAWRTLVGEPSTPDISSAPRHDDYFNPGPSSFGLHGGGQPPNPYYPSSTFAQASGPWPAATAQQAGHGTLSVPQEAFVVERPQENRWNAPVQPAGYSPPGDSFFDGASEAWRTLVGEPSTPDISSAPRHDDDFNPGPSSFGLHGGGQPPNPYYPSSTFAQASGPWPAATAHQAGHGTLPAETSNLPQFWDFGQTHRSRQLASRMIQGVPEADESLIKLVTSTLETEGTGATYASALRHLASWLAQQKTQGHGHDLASLARLEPTRIQSILDQCVQAHPHLQKLKDPLNAAFVHLQEKLTPDNVLSRRRGRPMKGVPLADERLIGQALSTVVNENTRVRYATALRHLAVWLAQQKTQGHGHDLASLARLDAAQADGIREEFLQAFFEKKNLNDGKNPKEKTSNEYKKNRISNEVDSGFHHVRNLVISSGPSQSFFSGVSRAIANLAQAGEDPSELQDDADYAPPQAHELSATPVPYPGYGQVGPSLSSQEGVDGFVNELFGTSYPYADPGYGQAVTPPAYGYGLNAPPSPEMPAPGHSSALHAAPEIVAVDDIPSPPTRTRPTAAQRLAREDAWLADDDFVNFNWMLEQRLQGQPNAHLMTFLSPAVARLLADETHRRNHLAGILRDYVGPDRPPIIFVPVNNHNNHWSLLVVNQFAGTAYHYDSNADIRFAHQTLQFGVAREIARALGVGTPTISPMARQRDGHSCGDFVMRGTEELAKRVISGEVTQDGGMDLSTIRPDAQYRQYIVDQVTLGEQFRPAAP